MAITSCFAADMLYSSFTQALLMLCSCLICALQGIVGATFGRRLLDLVGVKNNVARGVAIGLFFNTLFL
jgi:putative effector of murein hydrolase